MSTCVREKWGLEGCRMKQRSMRQRMQRKNVDAQNKSFFFDLLSIFVVCFSAQCLGDFSWIMDIL